jgi:hypothetical protein
VPAPKPALNWARLWQLAIGRGGQRSAGAAGAGHPQQQVLR